MAGGQALAQHKRTSVASLSCKRPFTAIGVDDSFRFFGLGLGLFEGDGAGASAEGSASAGAGVAEEVEATGWWCSLASGALFCDLVTREGRKMGVWWAERAAGSFTTAAIACQGGSDLC